MPKTPTSSAFGGRVTADGFDALDADPLFPDLDRLEELLTETRQEDAAS